MFSCLVEWIFWGYGIKVNEKKNNKSQQLLRNANKHLMLLTLSRDRLIDMVRKRNVVVGEIKLRSWYLHLQNLATFKVSVWVSGDFQFFFDLATLECL